MMKDVIYSKEYRLIHTYYGQRKASRSQVPLINHINEGLDILEGLGASNIEGRAFCLHPLLQDDHALVQNWARVALDCPADSVLLAMEYRRAANAYLCRDATDHYTQVEMAQAVGSLLPQVRLMLIADKRQNQKDFRIYHKGTHVRSPQLERYFINWRIYLEDL